MEFQRAPLPKPMAFISDVHGNLPALEAVLHRLNDEGVSELYVAGDLLLGGAHPLEVWQRLQQAHAKCTRGLSDTALTKIDASALHPTSPKEQEMAEQFVQTQRSLGDLVLERLRRLPEALRVPLLDGREVVVTHGSPIDASQAMTHDMDDEELSALMGDDPADIVVCGGSHVPFHRKLGEVDIVNVGSVGAAPEGRIAHYTVVTPSMGQAEVIQDWVEY